MIVCIFVPMITSTSLSLQTSLSMFIKIFLPWSYYIQCSWCFYCPSLLHSPSFPILWLLKIYLLEFFLLLLISITHVQIIVKTSLKIKDVGFCKETFLKKVSSATLFKQWLLCYAWNLICSLHLWHIAPPWKGFYFAPWVVAGKEFPAWAWPLKISAVK